MAILSKDNVDNGTRPKKVSAVYDVRWGGSHYRVHSFWVIPFWAIFTAKGYRSAALWRISKKKPQFQNHHIPLNTLLIADFQK